MKISKILIPGLLVIFIGMIHASAREDKPSADPAPSNEKPVKIISMAPSITEVLFALGLGDRVAGVTRFCRYPEDALKKQKVGGFFDPNYEVILSLKPDLVVILMAHKEAKDNLKKLGIKVLSVDHDSIKGILDSIELIGHAAGKREKANELLAAINLKLAKIQEKVKGANRPKILISASRIAGTGTVKNINIAGKSSFYNEIINMAGGTNAYDQGGMAYPSVSIEGIISMKPDYIIDVVPTLKRMGLDEKAVVNEWKGVAPANIFDNGRVHVFWRDYTVIPGPRFVKIVERIARVIHPELDWD